MKLSLALGPRQPLSRQMAAGCLTTNLAMPGFGSLLAGRKVGYYQAALTIVGFAISTICTIQTLIWFVPNRSHWQDFSEAEPVEAALEMWQHLRWPLLGLGIFVVALIWALITSMSVREESRKAEALRPLPPKLR